MSSSVHFTVSDLALLAEDGKRYEIIDGDLYGSTQPHWRHQFTADRIVAALTEWGRERPARFTGWPAPERFLWPSP